MSNEDNKGNDPYGANSAPQGNPTPNPYGFPSAPQGNQNPSPYGTPPAANPSSPQSPYAFNNTPPQQAQQNPYSAPQGFSAPQQAENPGGFSIFGLTWKKNIVPNPAGVPAAAKSNVIAYVLWFFLGWAGVHQFYLGNTNRGLFNLILGVGTSVLGMVGIPVGIIYFAYWVYEAVTLNDQTLEINSGYIRKSIL